jgi:hypothetical protein
MESSDCVSFDVACPTELSAESAATEVGAAAMSTSAVLASAPGAGGVEAGAGSVVATLVLAAEAGVSAGADAADDDGDAAPEFELPGVAAPGDCAGAGLLATFGAEEVDGALGAAATEFFDGVGTGVSFTGAGGVTDGDSARGGFVGAGS